jgi:hypothetical protein
VFKDCSVKKPKNPTLPKQGLVWRGIFVMPHDLAGVDSDENPSNFHQQN